MAEFGLLPKMANEFYKCKRMAETLPEYWFSRLSAAMIWDCTLHTASYKLAALEDIGMVEKRKRGRCSEYRLVCRD